MISFEQTKELISQDKITKENCLEVIKSFIGNCTEEALNYFYAVCEKTSDIWQPNYYPVLIRCLDEFHDKLEDTIENRFKVYYARIFIYSFSKDFVRAIDICFKAKQLEGLQPAMLFYTNTMLVNILFDNHEYKYALDENLAIFNSAQYEDNDDSSKLIIIANNALIYTALVNFEEANKYYKLGKKMLKKLQEPQNLKTVFDLIEIYMACKFVNDKFDSNYVLEKAKKLPKLIDQGATSGIYENFTIYAEIFDNLLANSNTKIVYDSCKVLLSKNLNMFALSSIYKYYVRCFDKNKDSKGYLEALEKYVSALEDSANENRYNASTFYVQISSFYSKDKQYKDLKENYEHDSLTKCLSRAAFDEAQEENDFNSILYIDLNDLKVVNDTYGHNFGDKYLNLFGHNLLDTFKGDNVYRVGGDEFVVTSKIDSEEELVNALNKLNELPLYDTLEGDKFSAGALLNVNKKKLKELIILADEQLYLAKNDISNFYHLLNNLK